MTDAPKLNANGYEILHHVQAGVGSHKIVLGRRGSCRFCGEGDSKHFRHRSHTIPEGLGNHWILSADECDRCNKLFSKYDDALCKSVGTILTVGGTEGKGGKVRQTGRSKGSNNIRHSRPGGQRRISYQVLSEADGISAALGTAVEFSADGKIKLTMPMPSEVFVPRSAYKALVKVGLALLPDTELPNFQRLLQWLTDESESEEFSFLDVGISCGSLGNAPPIVSATILRRKSIEDRIPYVLLMVTAGSICWQIDLMPDVLDNEIGLAGFGCINLRWNTILGPRDGDQIKIAYSEPRHFDWSSNLPAPSPINALRQHFDQNTLEGQIELEWRDMPPS
ncbi:MAG TPA: hypothetical protein VHG29_07990 [Novosphingobium sp.]|nr:hypothetical protein [Novosphingobium sp.]